MTLLHDFANDLDTSRDKGKMRSRIYACSAFLLFSSFGMDSFGRAKVFDVEFSKIFNNQYAKYVVILILLLYSVQYILLIIKLDIEFRHELERLDAVRNFTHFVDSEIRRAKDLTENTQRQIEALRDSVDTKCILSTIDDAVSKIEELNKELHQDVLRHANAPENLNYFQRNTQITEIPIHIRDAVLHIQQVRNRMDSFFAVDDKKLLEANNTSHIQIIDAINRVVPLIKLKSVGEKLQYYFFDMTLPAIFVVASALIAILH